MTNSNGDTSLLSAVYNGNREVVEYLVDNNANSVITYIQITNKKKENYQ